MNLGWLALVTAICIAISAALYTLVEHPAEARPRWLIRRPAPTPVPGRVPAGEFTTAARALPQDR